MRCLSAILSVPAYIFGATSDTIRLALVGLDSTNALLKKFSFAITSSNDCLSSAILKLIIEILAAKMRANKL